MNGVATKPNQNLFLAACLSLDALPVCNSYDTPRSRDESELRQNVTDATTAVLGYASLVLHRSPSSVEDGSARCADSDHLDGVNDQHQSDTDHRSGNSDWHRGDGHQGGCKDVDSDSNDHHRHSDRFSATPNGSPNGCLDDTVPLDSHDAMPILVPRKHKHNGFPTIHGGVVDAGGARGWEEGELHARKAEAVTAAGRRARVSYCSVCGPYASL